MFSVENLHYAGAVKVLRRGRAVRQRLRIISLVGGLLAAPAWAQDAQYMFLQAGKLQLNDEDTTVTANGATLDGDYDDLPFFTGGVQKIMGGGDRFRYGYEGGAVISWQNDSVSYSGVVNGGATVNVKVENEMFLFGTLLGGYGDINFGDRARLFLSGGPMLLLGSLKQEQEKPYPQPLSTTVVVNGDDRDFSFGYGAYASLGLIFSVGSTSEFGFVVREQTVEMDFNDAIADFPYDGTQYMLSFGYRM